MGTAALAALGCLTEWVTPSPWQLVTLVSAGLLSGFAQLLMTEGYRAAETTLVAPFEYGAIIYATMLGIAIWVNGRTCGTLLWIPFKYSEEAIPINKCEYQLVTGTTFNEKVDNIVKSQCDTYDLETCIDMGSDSEHLIIITNSLFADLEILPKLKGTSTHVTIWSFNINHVVINEVSPKLTLIEGYNIYVYLQLMGGLKITASDYMNKVLSLPHFKIITV